MNRKINPSPILFWEFGRFSRSIPVLKRWWPSLLKKIVKLTWEDGEKTIKTDFGIFSLKHINFIDRQIAFYGDFEKPQLDYLLPLMKKFRADVFLDIGANIGYYTVSAEIAAKPARIIAFEPDTRNLERLNINLELNGISDFVEIDSRAVSDRTGSAEFIPAPENSTGKSTIGVGDGAITLDCIALDDIYKFRGKTIFIKMDIEEHEFFAINGMKKLIGNNRIFMQMECFDQNFPKTSKLLESLGMRLCHEIGPDRYFKNFDLPV